MSRPRDRQCLLDILTNISLIQSFVSGSNWMDFTEDIGRQYQVIRGLEIIGEAARRLSPAARASLPEVPWKDWVDFRNRLTHGYDDISLDIVWSTVTEELPMLAAIIEDILTHKLPGE